MAAPQTEPLQRRQEEKTSSKAAQGEREMLEICALSVEAALERLEASEKGLEPDQVEERRERFGPNAVGKARKPGFLEEIFSRCKNPLVVQQRERLAPLVAIGALLGR